MANRLIHCKSPYLLQHARNPVDWYPWGDEAFQKARQEEKLIFLSVGYSTCHWCHVMERESFSDADVAALLNRYYVSIKVDREERPDLDHVYMAVCQALTGQGGWPLTVILTPDQKPVFAGTYFPKESRFGLPGLRDILPRIAEMWRQDRSGLDEAGDKIMAAVEGVIRNHPGPLTPAMVDQGFRALGADYDAEYGGFGSAPKFPTSHNMLFLLRYWGDKGEESALAMAQKTLHAMYRGGIYDHIGFGFARYSTDREWRVPHFEKMLYDNALLAYAYLEAYQATRDAFYARVAREVFSYVRREMTSPEGAFYTAQDADSEGMEGKFYLWTPAEVKAVLGEEDGSLFCTAYDVTGEGHFQGKSVPNLIRASLPETAKRLGLSEDALFARLEEARRALFAARRRRVPPHTDDKILTASNALMIAALAKGARVLGDGELRGQAQAALDFVLSRLRRPDGRLLARYRDGEAAFPAYLDDYAYLVWALIEMYESNFDPGYLRLALELNARMLDLFWDEDSCGLFFYGKDADTLVARPKEVYDGATPSGNSVAALNLLHLARLTADKMLEERAQAHLEAFAGEVSRHPAGHTFFLLALQLAFAPSREAVVVGQPGAKDTEAMLQELRTAYDPHMLLLFRPTGEEGKAIEAVAPFLREMNALDGGKATAYLCRNYACQAPTTDPDDLRARLTAGHARPGANGPA